MTEKITLRSGRDRLRYTIIFETLLMMMFVPAGAAFFDKPIMDFGLLGIILSGKAMILNLVYNWAFGPCRTDFKRTVALGEDCSCAGF